jgi:hypothetical protein
VVAYSNIEVVVDDRGAFNKKKFIFGFVRGEELVKKSLKMSASGSDLATDGPVCPHFGSDCWANLGTCVRIRIGHGRFFATIYVRIRIEPLTYSRVLTKRDVPMGHDTKREPTSLEAEHPPEPGPHSQCFLKVFKILK